MITRRERDGDPDCASRIRKMGRNHADAIVEMRTMFHERGTVNNRDFEMASRTRTQSYRGGGIGLRVCALCHFSRRKQAGCTGNSRAAAA